MSNETVFGKIIRGEIPATKVYEDEQFLAFLDIHPVSKGHTLLIPKEQYIWMHDVPNDVISAIFLKAKEIMSAMKHGLRCDYVQLSVVGKDVPHFHIHLIPRYFGDALEAWPTDTYLEGEMDSFAQQIKSGL